MNLDTPSSRPVGAAVAHLLDKQVVVGSNPTRVTTSSDVAFFENLEVAMSDVKQVIVVRTDLNMRKGKMIAQGAHAAMKFLVDNNESERGDEIVVKLSLEEAQWLLSGSFTKAVVRCGSEEELRDLIFRAELADIEVHPIIDAGKTEFHGVPTLTCAAFGPCKVEELDKITGHLPLL